MGGISTETFSLCVAAEQHNADTSDQNTMNSPETSTEALQEEEMDVSNPTEENKDEPEKQPEVSSLGATPQVNQAENTPSDNPTAMEISVPKNKNTKQNSKSGKETKRLKTENARKSLMKCPNCQAEIVPSVKFQKEKEKGQCEFNIGLHQYKGDEHTDLFPNNISFGEGAGNVSLNECLHCNKSIIYESLAKRTNKIGGFDIELTIDISKENKLEEKSEQQDNLGGIQSQNRHCDKGMEQDDMDDSSSEKTTGCNADNSSKQNDLNTVVSKRTENSNPSSRKPKQSNQTTNSEGLSFSNFFKPSTPVVKVHYTPNTDTFGADTEIMNQLKNNLKLEETTRNNCSIIIVFCPVSRSFESEIKSAMEKEEVSSSGKPVILVLMHHTRDPDHSTTGYDASEVLKNVFHVHVFYHETVRGLLTCKQNTMAIKNIEKKLQTYKQ